MPDIERQEYVTNQLTVRVQELSTLLTKEKIKTLVSSEPYVIYDEGIVDRIALWQKLEIQAPDVHPRNIDFALRIVREYDFEGALNRTLTLEEEKAIVQSLLRPSKIDKGEAQNTDYISTLHSKLMEAGLTEQEAYGAAINYAIGRNESYVMALGGQTKYSSAIIAEIKTDIIEETIAKAVIKRQKKAAKLAKEAVAKETIIQIDDTLAAIDSMVVEREEHKRE